MIKISIIIPVYNVQEYIIKCLESVASQTYEGKLECLIIDDCGQDDSIRLTEEFVASYKGGVEFRIIHHDCNKGLSAARNTGINESKGEWLYFLDSDDWIIENCIELFAETLKRHPQTEIVFSGANANSPICSWLDYGKKKLLDFSTDRNWIQRTLLLRYPLGMTAWNKLISKEFLIKHDLYFCNNLIHEDELWNFRLAQTITYIAFVKCNTYNYNLRPESLMTKASEDVVWNRLCTLWYRMSNSIISFNSQIQIFGLCTFLFERTRYSYPPHFNKKIARILLKLSYKSRFPYNLYLLVQSIMAFSNNKKYFNDKIRKRLTLK